MTYRSWSASLTLLLVVTASAQNKTYIALGDSVGWGYQPNSTSRSAGDKGYVKIFADWLGTVQGTRPKLINLSIPGETTASFNNTSEIGGLLNSNYPLFGRPSQASLFVTKVGQETAAGRTVTHVTYALGANDLLDLLTTQFLALPLEQQKAAADQALAAASTRIESELQLVRLHCPNASVTVPGYYNPYHAFPGSPEDTISLYSIPKLNKILMLAAKRHKAGFAATYPSFVGHELDYTWIGENDVHPRNSGYSVIAGLVVARAQSNLDVSPAP